ncbi:isochorismatase family protein [Sneathiella sp. P13V-1]|uniref:cysteine hydrolase family protein n=1 Tax=Sneathiella sp. P13V-1 TaxID=2697366 RepID=UPI00187B5772|nr:cysteine hydrolase [Sneathiella sp. P13V-1]MBE7635399.1 isochorismatase family protein [Sneathiella sp. P13V-1]
MSKSALLIIDVQIDNVDPNGPYPFPEKDVESLITTINQLSEQWRSKSQPVIFVRQVFKSVLGRLVSRLLLGGITIEGNPGVEVDPRLNSNGGIIVDKTKQDAFASSDILTVLRDHGVTDVYIAGLDGAYCVAETAKGALDNGFTTHLITNAIITNKPEKAAQKMKQLKLKGVNGTLASDVS